MWQELEIDSKQFILQLFSVALPTLSSSLCA